MLLPAGSPDGERGEALAEYASVAAFNDLALRLLAVGAPTALVAGCQQAAADEIRHAVTVARLAGDNGGDFGAIAGLRGRRIGRRWHSRRRQLSRIAAESFVDGWLNETAAAAALRRRAEMAATAEERDVMVSIADDEAAHADLARQIVVWCHSEEPVAVGKALAACMR